jgi:8-oxo-dGTP pyrophosphatase MutT (NUDIX family)
MTEWREPVLRLAARVLLCDPEGRVLLFKTKVQDRHFWITPGGGLNEGETHEAAAARELWEETGLQADCDLLSCVWTRAHSFMFRDHFYDQRERYFFLRCDASLPISPENREEYEREDLVEHRWWSVEEIEASEELFVPRRLGLLLRDLLRDGPPLAPFEVGV